MYILHAPIPAGTITWNNSTKNTRILINATNFTLCRIINRWELKKKKHWQILNDTSSWGALTSYNKKEAVDDNVLEIHNDPIRSNKIGWSVFVTQFTVTRCCAHKYKQLSIMSFRICNANKRIILMCLWRPIITVQNTYMPH